MEMTSSFIAKIVPKGSTGFQPVNRNIAKSRQGGTNESLVADMEVVKSCMDADRALRDPPDLGRTDSSTGRLRSFRESLRQLLFRQMPPLDGDTKGIELGTQGCPGDA